MGTWCRRPAVNDGAYHTPGGRSQRRGGTGGKACGGEGDDRKGGGGEGDGGEGDYPMIKVRVSTRVWRGGGGAGVKKEKWKNGR